MAPHILKFRDVSDLLRPEVRESLDFDAGVAADQKFLDISTDHLRTELRDTLFLEDGVWATRLEYDGCWLMWVPADPAESASQQAALDDPIAPDLLAIQVRAREFGCDYVLFHRDAERDDYLPAWTEEGSPILPGDAITFGAQ